jgi:hypothetical protein
MHYCHVVLVLLLPVLIVAQGVDIQTDDTEVTPIKRIYAKGNILMGVGFDKVHAGDKYIEGEYPEKINIYPGGGVGVEVVLGYDISSNFAAEIGIGTQSSGESVSNGHIYFKKMPLRISGIYRLKNKKAYTVFIGCGASFDLSPKFSVKEDDDEAEVTYFTNTGFHGLIGLDFFSPKSPFYFAGEIRFVGMPDYELDEAPWNAIFPSDISALSANGIHFVFTMGYYFK